MGYCLGYYDFGLGVGWGYWGFCGGFGGLVGGVGMWGLGLGAGDDFLGILGLKGFWDGLLW